MPTLLTLVLTLFTFTILPLSAPAQATAAFQAPVPYDGKTANLLTNFGKRNIGGVRMSDGPNFTGHVWYGIYPLNTCIDLRDYSGNLLSFRPDEGNECLVMQGRCNGNDEFADLLYNSTNIGNLGEYFWMGNVSSYICVEE